MVKSDMRLSWWLGRCRRYGPTVVILLSVVYFCWRIASQPALDNFPGKVRVEPDPITDEDRAVLEAQEPPSPLLPNWWVIAWNNKFSCSQLAAALSKRWTILLASKAQSTKYSHSRCMFMNVTLSDSMNSHILRDMYKRAIKGGAEAIYVMADRTTLDDIQMVDSQLVDVEVRRHLSVAQHQLPLSPKLSTRFHFGCAFRNSELPDDNVDSAFEYSLCSAERLSILSPLATYEDKSNDQVQCDKYAPAIMAREHTYVEMMLFGSVFFRSAFWALPLDVDFERARWHLVVQHSLWTGAGGSVAVYHARDNLDSGLVIPDRSFEVAMLRNLDSLQCSEPSAYACVLSTLDSLNQWTVLAERSVQQLKQWFSTLRDELAVSSLTQKQAFDCLPKKMQFRPSQPSARNTISEDASRNVELSSTLVQNLCSPLLPEPIVRAMTTALRRPWKRLEGTLLVIVFNNAHYEAIAYVEALYRPFFPHILYCGPGQPPHSNYHFSFASYVGTPAGHANGSLNYECALHAYSMYPNMPGGYLLVADDILLLLHKIADLPTEQTWFIPREEVRVGEVRRNRECRLGMCDFYTRWPWWLDYQNVTISALLGIRQRANTSQLFNRCYRRLIDSNGALLRANGGYADIYHIPRRQMAGFVQLAAYFLDHGVFLEIAIPTIIRCLESDSNISPLYGIQSWDADYRDRPWHYFKQAELVGKTYFHPTKWGFVERGSQNHTTFFCKALEFIGDRYGRIKS